MLQTFKKKSSFFSFLSSVSLLILLCYFTACSSDEITKETGEDSMVMGDPEGNDSGVDPMVVIGDNDEEGSEPEEPSNVLPNGDIKLSESLFLDKSKGFTTKILSPSEYDKFLTKDLDVTSITKDIYKYYNDDFDLITILGVEESQPSELCFFGRNSAVQNAVSGIGGSMFNQGERFGAVNKLKGVIYMPSTNYIKSGPFLHEIMHIWANKNFIPTTVGAHWGYSSAGGQLGGFDMLEELGDNTYKGTVDGRSSFGTFANGGNSLLYSNLELYVMGLIGEDELEPIQVAVNPESNGNPGEFTADRIDTYSVEQLIERNGKRVPSVINSQKTFKSLTVVITPTELSQDKKKEINDMLTPFFAKGASNFGNTFNFWEATQGKAFIENTVADKNLL